MDGNRKELERHQASKLAALLDTTLEANPFYRRKFLQGGLTPARVREIVRSHPDDPHAILAALPFTTKQEIQEDQASSPPYGTDLSEPLERYTRLHRTSGTTGRPIHWLDTPQSWEWFLGCWDHVLDGVPAAERDCLFVAFSFGPFIGFWGAFECAVRRGLRVLPGGGMTSAARLRFLLDHKATIVACTPTYALRLAEVAEEEGLDLPSSPVRALIVAGEPGGSIPATRERIENAWGARVYDHCGMTEIGAYGYECLEAPGGMHVVEREFVVEIVDPGGSARKRPGEEGEIVLTNLGRTGSPLIRYRTGDLGRLAFGTCACGRLDARLEGGILARLDDMIFVKGTNVYPSAVEAVLRRFHDIVEYRVRVSSTGSLAELVVEVEPRPNAKAGLEEEVADALYEAFLVKPRVQCVPAGSLPRFEHKARRFERRDRDA